MKPAAEEHRKAAPSRLRVALITVSTSRYQRKVEGEEVVDESGATARRMVEQAGHKVTVGKLVDDDAGMIRLELLRSLYEEKADAAILMGGTGLAPRDVTVEAVKPLLDKELEGFGEILRSVSFEKIGAPALLTRALAGSIGGRLVLCLPGSPHAVETALDLILPELPHAVYIAK